VYLPSGQRFGTLLLRHSPSCAMSWGAVWGPDPRLYRVYITARRPADGVHAPSSWALNTPPGSYGNMLSTSRSCVMVEACPHRSPPRRPDWPEAAYRRRDPADHRRDGLAQPDHPASGYVPGVLGPTVLFGTGIGLCFMPVRAILTRFWPVDAGSVIYADHARYALVSSACKATWLRSMCTPGSAPCSP
jgi:hypothetical protein